MFNYNNLSIRRVVMHHIHAKLPINDFATVTYEAEIIEINKSVEDTIKTRLTDAAGKDSRAFELEIAEQGVGHFYHHCHDIKNLDDSEFVTKTQVIADLLAESQTSSNIPGGYFIFMEAIDEDTNLHLYIVIKADPQKVLLHKTVEGTSTIELLDKVFLSPSQKLFKIAILFEKELPAAGESIIPNEHFGCFLFDDQFRTDGHPAEFFYKSFLGFSVGNNSKIQSKIFYDKTEEFIIETSPNYETMSELLAVMKSQFITDLNPTLTPSVFAGNVFTGDLRDQYTAQVLPSLAPTFVKDQTLIKSKLANKKILFPNNIKITGPDEGFDTRVEMFYGDSLEDLDITNPEYTIIRIQGKPFQHE